MNRWSEVDGIRIPFVLCDINARARRNVSSAYTCSLLWLLWFFQSWSTLHLPPPLQSAAQDAQDSVRLLGVNAAVEFAGILTNDEDIINKIIPIVRAASTDKSWRVRYTLADKITNLQAACKEKITETYLVDIYKVSAYAPSKY